MLETGGAGSVGRRGRSSCGVAKKDVKREALPVVAALIGPSFFEGNCVSSPSALGEDHMLKNLSGPGSITKGASTLGLSNPKKEFWPDVSGAALVGGSSVAGVFIMPAFMLSFHF